MMTKKELDEQYPNVIWTQAYNSSRVLGHKEGDTKYSYVIKGSNLSVGDYTPMTVEDFNRELKEQYENV